MMRFPEEGDIVWAQLGLGASLAMVGAVPPADAEGGDAPFWNEVRGRLGQGGAVSTYFEAGDDVDAHFAKARDAGADVVAEPDDKWWGLREYTVRDPDGNLLNLYQTPKPKAETA